MDELPPPLEELNNLKIVPEDAAPLWFQNRGRSFERIINRALAEEGLDPRTGYRPSGEEIDGSFLLGDKVYLLEAKWTKKPMPASTLYNFKGKVDGKLAGTIGVFISMSGYSEDAINALVAGKEINLILFNGDDFDLSLSPGYGLRRAMLTKLRVAAERGTPYFPLKDERVHVDKSTPPLDGAIQGSKRPQQVDFVVEGLVDAALIRAFTERLVPEGSDHVIRFHIAGGKRNIPFLVMEILATNKHSKIVMVADGDNEKSATEDMLDKVSHGAAIPIVIDPHIEVWFEEALKKDDMTLEGIMRLNPERRINCLRKYAETIDLDELKQAFDSFNALSKVFDPPKKGSI